MITNAYCIYDLKSQYYSTPWFQPTDGVAVRIFSDLANDPSTNVGRHPADYILFRVGSYDDSKGQMLPIVPVVHVADAMAVVQQKPADLFTKPTE